MNQTLQETCDWLKEKGIDGVEVGIVLGTGLGNLVTQIEVIKEFSYNVIPNFPVATIEYHFGKLIFGTLGGKKILACQGRFHYYEGYTMDEVVLPVRVMKVLGAKNILLSNAAGALNLSFKKGTLMLVDDHINLQPENPLRGENDEELGLRFPDMSQPYSSKLNDLIRKIADEKKIILHKGVYVSVQGPNLETRAEYRYLRIIGGDAVGMSTVPEVIACNHMKIPCCCISVLTDECDPENLKPVSVEEIITTAKEAEVFLTELYVSLVSRL
ncbi:MAG: purine-nucleoside phosphorylase [Flavobacteriales bacterium]|nr:purine-nucleoside phosphorylase [Flavobacteriales bacterium]